MIQSGSPFFTYIHTSNLTLDVWAYLAMTIAFNSGSGLTTVYLNGSQAGAVYASETYIKDENTIATQLIGTDVNLSNCYKGFIWKVEIYNYVSSIVNTNFVAYNQPFGLAFQLSPCPFIKVINCQPCEACSNGCVGTADCSLCLDPLCGLCSDIAVCDQCVPHASNMGLCLCDFGYLMDAIARTCNPCAPECGECNGLTISSCLSCQRQRSTRWLVAFVSQGFPRPTSRQMLSLREYLSNMHSLCMQRLL